MCFVRFIGILHYLNRLQLLEHTKYIIILRRSRTLNIALNYDDNNGKVRHRRVRDKGRQRSIFKMLHVSTHVRRDKQSG